jgi:uncharacterized protein (DUF305 family)
MAAVRNIGKNIRNKRQVALSTVHPFFFERINFRSEYSLAADVYPSATPILIWETTMRRNDTAYRSRLLLTATCLAAMVALAAPSTAATLPANLAAEADYWNQNTAAMNKMMAAMVIKPSGDVDNDFVAMMQPHHQGAIDMAQGELSFGHNEQLTRIAQGIIVEQLQEIAAMRLAIGESASPSWITSPVSTALVPAPNRAGEAPYLAQNNIAMATMMANMALPPTGDVDHDFVAMMAPHHQGAIDMAQAELRYGHNMQLQQVAQEIIVDQIQEITVMRVALGEKLPASLSSPTQGGPPTKTTEISTSPDALEMLGAMSMGMSMGSPAAATDK